MTTTDKFFPKAAPAQCNPGPIQAAGFYGTGSQTWVILGWMEWPGSDEFGEIGHVSMYVDNQDAIKTCGVRLYDLDNQQTLAQNLTVDHDGEAIVNLPVFQDNVPTSRCRIAIEGRCNAGGHQMYVQSTTIHTPPE